MFFRPVIAVVFRYFYLLRSSPAQWVPIFAWVAIDIVRAENDHLWRPGARNLAALGFGLVRDVRAFGMLVLHAGLSKRRPNRHPRTLQRREPELNPIQVIVEIEVIEERQTGTGYGSQCSFHMRLQFL